MKQRPALGIDARRRRAPDRERVAGALPAPGNGHAEMRRERVNATEPLCTSRGPGPCICKLERDHVSFGDVRLCLDSPDHPGGKALSIRQIHECACGNEWPVKEAA